MKFLGNPPVDLVMKLSEEGVRKAIDGRAISVWKNRCQKKNSVFLLSFCFRRILFSPGRSECQTQRRGPTVTIVSTGPYIHNRINKPRNF
jgi:hypothetical protein